MSLSDKNYEHYYCPNCGLHRWDEYILDNLFCSKKCWLEYHEKRARVIAGLKTKPPADGGQGFQSPQSEESS